MMESSRLANPTARPDALRRWIGWCAYGSGAASVFGIGFLVIFFAGAPAFGPLNDAMVVVQYSLMIPLALWIGQRQARQGLPASRLALATGLIGMVGVIALQLMLIGGLIPFSRQMGPVSIAFLVVLARFVWTGRLAKDDDLISSKGWLLWLAGLYVGYPIWAFPLGRRLLGR